VSPDGVTFKAEKEKGREETEFIRSEVSVVSSGRGSGLVQTERYMWWVFIIRRRFTMTSAGPQHGPANAAIRPHRDHLNSAELRKVRHKQAKTVEVPVLDATITLHS